YLIRTDILRDMPDLYRQIARYAAETPLQAPDWLKPMVVLLVVLFPTVIRGWVFRRDAVEDESGETASVGSALLLFPIAWLALELAGAVMQRRMYSYHFLPVILPAALIFGMLPRRDHVISLSAALLPAILISLLS